MDECSNIQGTRHCKQQILFNKRHSALIVASGSTRLIFLGRGLLSSSAKSIVVMQLHSSTGESSSLCDWTMFDVEVDWDIYSQRAGKDMDLKWDWREST